MQTVNYQICIALEDFCNVFLMFASVGPDVQVYLCPCLEGDSGLNGLNFT